MKQKTKFLIIVIAEFLLIIGIILLIFLSGKKVYTIKFDINGGTLLSGSLEQRVTQGQNATPPTITKEGCYFLEWEGKYTKVTRDATVKAVWEYETTKGIVYNVIEGSNYCTIKSCYPEVYGDVYIGAYYEDLKVLGIEDGAFKDCKYVENIYLLDGIINIGEYAFEGCTSLKSIEIPSTVRKISASAFKGCINLETVKINDGLTEICEEAFFDCHNLKEIIIPSTVNKIGIAAFNSDGIAINVYFGEGEIPDGWNDLWCISDNYIINYDFEPEESEEENEDDKKVEKRE